MHPAKAARLSKEKNPEHYCTFPNCLWRTYDFRTDSFEACGNHGAFYLHVNAVKKEEQINV